MAVKLKGPMKSAIGSILEGVLKGIGSKEVGVVVNVFITEGNAVTIESDVEVETDVEHDETAK